MFSKKKKKPQISLPTSFVHRVHTGFDKREGRYVGLPPQWASIVGNNQILKSTNRPLPLVDPSEITPTEILDLKTIVRHHQNNNKQDDSMMPMSVGGGGGPSVIGNGIVLPKTSNVARSNSLRSSSPPRVRRDLRGNANVPPSVPEEPIQYPSMRRDGTLGSVHGQPPPHDWNAVNRQMSNQQPQTSTMMMDGNHHGGGPQQQQTMFQSNGNVGGNPGMSTINSTATGPINVHIDMPPPLFR